MMRRRIGSESETVTILAEEESKELYKDKVVSNNTWSKNLFGQQFSNLTSKISDNFLKAETSAPQSAQQQSRYTQLAAESEEFSDRYQEPEFIMTARDRTTEFSNTIRSLQGRNIQRVVNLKDPKKVQQLQSYSEFMMIAKHIGKNIASTYAKLEKLTLRESFYNDTFCFY